MIQGGGFEPGMKQKPTDAPIPNEANNGLKNEQLHAGDGAHPRAALGHGAVLHQHRPTTTSSTSSRESPQGWGYAVFGKVVAGTEVVDAIEGVRTGRKRHATTTCRSRTWSSRARRSSTERHAAWPQASRLPALPADPTSCRAGRTGAPIDFISDLHLPTEHAAHLRRVGAATCAATPADAVFILGDLFEAWVGDDSRARAASRRAAPRCCRGGGAARRSASWPATATSWSATRCSRECGVAALPDPTVLRCLRPARAADARRRAVPRRHRVPALPRPGAQPGVAAAASWPAAAPSASAWRGRCATPAQRDQRAQPAADGPTSMPPRRCRWLRRGRQPRRWSTATPTGPAATRSRPAACATC